MEKAREEQPGWSSTMGRYKWVVMGKSHGRAAGLRLDSLEGPGSAARRPAGRVARTSQW